jgi:hypothetical protein
METFGASELKIDQVITHSDIEYTVTEGNKESCEGCIAHGNLNIGLCGELPDCFNVSKSKYFKFVLKDIE